MRLKGILAGVPDSEKERQTVVELFVRVLSSACLSRYLCFVGSSYSACACRQNMKRGFKHSAWAHGFIYLVLFGVISYLTAGALISANHNVLARCNGDLPAPHAANWLQESHGPGHGLGDHDFKDSFYQSRNLTESDEGDDGHHGKHHEDDGSDGDHHGHGHHDHSEHDDDDGQSKSPEGKGKGHKGKHSSKKPCKKNKSSAAWDETSTDDFPVKASVTSSSFQTVSTFATQRMGGAVPEGQSPSRQDELLASRLHTALYRSTLLQFHRTRMCSTLS